jgi:hypothetical protein
MALREAYRRLDVVITPSQDHDGTT